MTPPLVRKIGVDGRTSTRYWLNGLGGGWYTHLKKKLCSSLINLDWTYLCTELVLPNMTLNSKKRNLKYLLENHIQTVHNNLADFPSIFNPHLYLSTSSTCIFHRKTCTPNRRLFRSMWGTNPISQTIPPSKAREHLGLTEVGQVQKCALFS